MRKRRTRAMPMQIVITLPYESNTTVGQVAAIGPSWREDTIGSIPSGAS